MKLPQKLVRDGKLVAVFFDEVQEVNNLNGFEFQKRLRSVIQHQNKVCYIFCGSKHHLFQNIFNDPNNPLFKAGKTKYLNVIPEKEYSSFIYKHFIKIKNETKTYVISFLRMTKFFVCVPGYICIRHPGL